MPADFLTLLRRDHADLFQELTRLLDPTATVAQLRSSLDGVRLGLTAHAEAEDIVLSPFEAVPDLKTLVDSVRASHRQQEVSLMALVTTRPGTVAWRERAQQLRDLIALHAAQEESEVLPALRAQAEAYDKLAGAFATERLRQLAMLQPSAPVFAPFVLSEARAS